MCIRDSICAANKNLTHGYDAHHTICVVLAVTLKAVSYTHLDVYKRQEVRSVKIASDQDFIILAST